MRFHHRPRCRVCGHEVVRPVRRLLERLVFAEPGCHAAVASPWDVVSAHCGCAADCHGGRVDGAATAPRDYPALRR